MLSFASLRSPRLDSDTTNHQHPRHKLDLHKAKLTAFRRNLSAKSRNLAMSVADGIPTRMKELLTKRCIEHGMGGFATTVFAQELLVDVCEEGEVGVNRSCGSVSDNSLQEYTVNSNGIMLQVEQSNMTLVESGTPPRAMGKLPPSPGPIPPPSDPAFRPDDVSGSEEALDNLEGETLIDLTPGSCPQSPFSDEHAVMFQSDWTPSLASTPSRTDTSDTTLVEPAARLRTTVDKPLHPSAGPSPSPFGSPVIRLGGAPGFDEASDILEGETLCEMTPDSCTRSPFSDEHSVQLESGARETIAVPTGWSPSLTSTPPGTDADALDDDYPRKSRTGRESFSLDLEPGSSFSDDFGKIRKERVGLGFGELARPSTLELIGNPFEDPGLQSFGACQFVEKPSTILPGAESDSYFEEQSLDKAHFAENPFVCPGAELESYLELCYPDPLACSGAECDSDSGDTFSEGDGRLEGRAFSSARCASDSSDIFSQDDVRTGERDLVDDKGSGSSYCWDEHSEVGSLRRDEVPYSIPDSFALQ
ncbi:hypothetical protein NMY22_g18818 [Coprinellus aureogranulatus]|nr:hypothetical protein NMY22_g18818 [Coprinellus aureogranulatus]